MLCEMQSVSSRIWTRVAVSISYDGHLLNIIIIIIIIIIGTNGTRERQRESENSVIGATSLLLLLSSLFYSFERF